MSLGFVVKVTWVTVSLARAKYSFRSIVHRMMITGSGMATKSIITIHGTGSNGRTEKHEKWWENKSVFCARMAALLPQEFTVDEPFEWSGRNWESSRLAAADELWKRLRRYEKEKQPYHIISHSHGGSVVWAALLRSAREKTKLDYLASWITVGTPFLTFTAAPTNWPLIFATLVMGFSIASVTVLISPPLAEIKYVVNAATALELGTTLAPLLISMIILMVSVAIILFNILSQLRYRRQRIHRQTAAKWYAQTWLGIWHSQDEPLAGLSATLDKGVSITNRREQTYPKPIRWIGSILDKILADVPDELAWRQVIRKLQGNDLGASVLASVDRCPRELMPGWPAIPEKISKAMLMTANSKAAATLQGMRALLGTAYETRNARGMVLGAGKLITWGELIHTSYFDSDDLVALLARHISTNGVPNDANLASPLEDAFAKLVEFPKPTALPTPTIPWSPKRLREVTAASALLISFLFLSLTVAISKSSIYPYTTDFQIRKIASAVLDQGVINVGANTYVGNIILQLMALGYLMDPLTVLNKLAKDNGRFEAAQPVAFAYGYNGDLEKVEDLVGAVTSDRVSFRAVTLRAAAIDGSFRGKRSVPEELVKDVANAILKMTSKDSSATELRRKFANALYRANQTSEANAILERLWKIAPERYSCEGETGIPITATIELQGAASFILDQCGKSTKWASRPQDRIRLLELAGRKSEATKAAALIPAAKTISQLAKQIKIELFRSDPRAINEHIKTLLPNSNVIQVGALHKLCGLQLSSNAKLASPIILPIGYHEFFDLGDIAQAYEDASQVEFAKPLYEIRERYLKLCVSSVVLDAGKLDWAENLLKGSHSDAETRILYEPTLALARQFDAERQYDLAVQAYTAVVQGGTMDLIVRRDVMFRLERLALAQDPPDLNSLLNLTRYSRAYDSDKGLIIRFQKSVVSTLSTTTDVATRSDARATLAIFMSQFGLPRDARLVAEGATVPKDLLRGYLGVLQSAVAQTKIKPSILDVESYFEMICESDCTG